MLAASYRTKKALKEAIGTRLQYVETSMFGIEYSDNATFPVVGPGPYDRKWYATVTTENGRIKGVK